jgi:hypothetical protein
VPFFLKLSFLFVIIAQVHVLFLFCFRLECFDVLWYLIINDNQLIHIPDFSSSPSRFTLQYMAIHNNQITNIPIHTISDLSAFSWLWASANPLRSLPNLCHLQRYVIIQLPEGTITCDCRMRWLKRIEATNGLSILTESTWRPCAEPPELVGVLWRDIPIENLTCAGR